MVYICCGFKIKTHKNLYIMKKLTLIALVTLLSFSISFAADGGKKSDDSNKVPYSVMRHFEYEFDNAKDIVWTVNNTFEKAEFTVNNVKMTAFYDSNGKYIGHTEVVAYNALPSGAKKQIAKNYEGYHVKELIRFQYADMATSSIAPLSASNNFDDEVYVLSLYKADKTAVLRISPNSSVETLTKN
jgi:hypothetical protein